MKYPQAYQKAQQARANDAITQASLLLHELKVALRQMAEGGHYIRSNGKALWTLPKHLWDKVLMQAGLGILISSRTKRVGEEDTGTDRDAPPPRKPRRRKNQQWE